MVQDKSIIELDSVNRHFFNALSAFEKAMVYQIVYLGGKPFGQESRQFFMTQFPDLNEQQIRNKIQYAGKKLIKSERFIKQNGAMTLIDLRFKEWFLNQPIESYLSNNPSSWNSLHTNEVIEIIKKPPNNGGFFIQNNEMSSTRPF